MNKTKELKTYEEVVLSVLAFEFSIKAHAESERKISELLQDNSLGSYEVNRVSKLRELKDDIQAEFGKWEKSEFYISSKEKYASASDWNKENLLIHMKKNHPDVSESAIESFLSTAIVIYYLK